MGFALSTGPIPAFRSLSCAARSRESRARPWETGPKRSSMFLRRARDKFNELRVAVAPKMQYTTWHLGIWEQRQKPSVCPSPQLGETKNKHEPHPCDKPGSQGRKQQRGAGGECRGTSLKGHWQVWVTYLPPTNMALVQGYLQDQFPLGTGHDSGGEGSTL